MCVCVCVCVCVCARARARACVQERDRERQLIFVSIHTFSRANLFAYEPCLASSTGVRKVSAHSLLIVLTRQTMTILFFFFSRAFIFRELSTKPCGKTTASLSVCHAAWRGVVTSQIAATVTSATFGSCFVLNHNTTVCVPV